MGGYLDNASIMQQHGMIEWEDDTMSSNQARVIEALEKSESELRQHILYLESLIAAFVVPHEALDDEATPGEKYDELMASWTLALTELRAYYHDHILGEGGADDER